ncbi:MAG: hypothetical protein KME43_02825 [Myxacorys chilensis ATA2-1-KO14]|jgi:hypothetical protein|nr:hypothetical protein [Myxacorys chilensis ATA2-1-KO14]
MQLRELRVLLLWISTSSLSLGLSFALAGWLEGAYYPPPRDFDLASPSLLGSLFAGFVLGVVQWLQLKDQGMRIPIRWILGTTLGIYLIATIGLINNNLSVWGSFNQPDTFRGSIQSTVKSNAVSGLLGGAILGGIQGWTLRTRVVWCLTNAYAWSMGWGAGRGGAYFIDSWGYWRLKNLSTPMQLAIHLGIVGIISGLISSFVTGIILLRLIRYSRVG